MRLLDFSVQGKTHFIVQLTIHLENEQFVTFRSSDNPDRVLTRGRHSMLTRFFELCASEAPENQVAKTMVYQDIPKLFRWDDKAKKWGPQSFAKLRTVDGVTYASYRQAALKLGYLEDDAEWIACMEEAAAFKMPYQLRQLFATIIVYSQVSEVRVLWNRFYDVLSEDFAHTYRGLEGQEKEDMIRFHTLKDLNDLLQINGYVVADFDLPQLDDYPRLVLDSLLRNNLIRRELEGYQHSTLQAIVDQESQLNDGQRAIYDEIIQAAEAPVQGNKLFFIDGPGGTGKSTLLRHILAKVRLSGKIAIAVASSGIAKIPLKLNDKSTCAIYKQSRLKMLIERASLVIWDEAPMTHRHAFEAVDRSLRDIMGNDQEPFGGKVFVLSGDFRQILPVVVRGTPAETIDACLKSSTLWRHFKQLHLTENMRVQSASNESTAAELAAFSEFLLQVGEGRHEVNRSLGRDFVKIPRDMLIDNVYEEGDDIEDEEITPGAVPRGLKNIIDKMYADINDPEVATDEYFANRTILTTTNAVVHRINQAVSERLSEEAREYLSVDSVDDDNEGNFFEPEVLHSVTINET
ncbi:helitron helicase-like protein [Phytophthora cinnamomi]|uniref:helitron helicase-like protein n=1 Tax=Phytophthora cinnamomi TaxID=4785 RepID=UPI003559FA9B|nr:helitron helicase-like protein [Phytophthora cinnamomi]